MGNCQAVEVATVVIQHPDGRLERLYWSITASQVMASNPGHYVAAIISSSNNNSKYTDPMRYVKLLRPDDTLLVGQVYRLVSFEDVLKEFASKKRVKLSRLLAAQQNRNSKNREKKERRGKGSSDCGASNPENSSIMNEEQQQGEEVHQLGSSSGVFKQRQWKPALQSIAEVGTGESSPPPSRIKKKSPLLSSDSFLHL